MIKKARMDTQATTVSLDQARRLDAYFRSPEFVDAQDINKPIDERSLIAAAADPNTIHPKDLAQLQARQAQQDQARVADVWASQAQRLPDLPTQPSMPQFQTLTPPPPKPKNKVMQTYADIIQDLKHFKSLPYKTNLQKVQACFFGDNRAYLTVTTFLAVCILIVIIVMLCIGCRKPK